MALDGQATTALELLRTHHTNVLNKSVNLDAVPELANSVFGFLQKEAMELAGSALTTHVAQHWVLRHDTLSKSIGSVLASKVCEGGGAFAGISAAETSSMAAAYLAVFVEKLSQPPVMSSMLADLAKACICDPATRGIFQPVFFLKGFQAVTTYRVAHALWMQARG